MRVVVATDGSEAAVEAAHRSIDLLRPDAEVVLVMVIPEKEDPMDDAGGIEGPLITEEKAEKDWAKATSDGLARLNRTASGIAPGAEIRLVPADEPPGAALVRVAAELQADVLVIGSGGKGLLRRIWSPSVSEYVVHRAHCPVLVVRHERPGHLPWRGGARVGTVGSTDSETVAMAEATVFTIGIDANCSDGVCGEVIRVVIDPVARAVTHLVVEPKHGQGLGRLVPLDLVDATPDEVRLRCTVAEFEKLALAEKTLFLPGDSGYGAYGPGEMAMWPYFGLSLGSGPEVVTYDTVPLGEVAIRRGERVHATDGDIGQVQGLVIDPRDHLVTHVLLQEGHLWGRKEVAVPIGAVTAIDDNGIRLNVTKREVENLPPVAVDHPTA